MNYELAKELKDAGFPQEERDKPSEEDYNRKRSDYYAMYRQLPIDVYYPTLSELLDACGMVYPVGIFHLVEYTDADEKGSIVMRWVARIVYGEEETRGRGKTPEEAVSKLWLELNNKI